MTPTARDLLRPHKTPLTARELLEQRAVGHAPVVRLRADDLLARRVERALEELSPGQWDDETAESLAAKVQRRLDGLDEPKPETRETDR